jgi:hypothetical protein
MEEQYASQAMAFRATPSPIDNASSNSYQTLQHRSQQQNYERILGEMVGSSSPLLYLDDENV